MGRWGEPIHFRIETLCLKLARADRRLVADALEEGPPGDRAVEWPLPEDRFWRLRPELDAAFVDYLEHQRETQTFRADDPFVDLYFDFLRFLNGLMVSDAAFSHVRRAPQGDGRIKILCKDPSRFLGGVINRAHATIGLSATLSPPEFYTGLLGFEAGRTAFVEIPNPFPPENRRVVIDPTVATTFKRAADELRAHRRAPGRVRRRGARQLPGPLPELRLPRRGHRPDAPAQQARPRSSARRTATRSARSSSRRCARRSSATSCWWRWPAASSPRGWTTPARC